MTPAALTMRLPGIAHYPTCPRQSMSKELS